MAVVPTQQQQWVGAPSIKHCPGGVARPEEMANGPTMRPSSEPKILVSHGKALAKVHAESTMLCWGSALADLHTCCRGRFQGPAGLPTV